MRFGVSPAYFFSRFGTRFTAKDLAASLSDLKLAGFTGFQAEIYHEEMLGYWCDEGMAVVGEAARAEGLEITQCVAHFLGSRFRRLSGREDPELGELFHQSITAALQLPGCVVLTLPLEKLDAPPSEACLHRFEATLRTFTAEVEKVGLRLALEPMPGSVIGSLQGFLEFRKCEGLGTLGLNFDTAHAVLRGETVEALPALLGDSILGVHLKDADPREQNVGAPGTGSICWPLLLQNLKASGYAGSLDIEFPNTREGTHTAYNQALHYLRRALY